MAAILSFRDLRVYQAATTAAEQVFLETKRWPREERYSLVDQVRRSSRAVAAMLAEAWARRLYPAAFVNKINEALGEAYETQAWLDHALRAGYLSAELHDTLNHEWNDIAGMLHRMVQQPDRFVPRSRFGS